MWVPLAPTRFGLGDAMEMIRNEVRQNLWKLESLGPTPHSPNWRYLCRVCLTCWEMEERLETYVQTCPPCKLYVDRFLQEGEV